MRTAIKASLLKFVCFTWALFLISFSFLASLVIFAESVFITQTLGYTKSTEYGILFAIGFILIWLVTLASDSASWILKSGFKKADMFKGVNNE